LFHPCGGKKRLILNRAKGSGNGVSAEQPRVLPGSSQIVTDHLIKGKSIIT